MSLDLKLFLDNNYHCNIYIDVVIYAQDSNYVKFENIKYNNYFLYFLSLLRLLLDIVYCILSCFSRTNSVKSQVRFFARTLE